MDSLITSSLAVLFLCSYISAASTSNNGYYEWYKRPCKQNDPAFNDCLLRTARIANPKMKNGDPERNLPSINPFFLPSMEIRTGSEQVGLKLKMKNVNIFGIGDIDILGLKGNMTKRKIEWQILTKTINLDGDYEAGGRILILPVTGKGKFDFTLKEMKVRLRMHWDLVKKSDGKEHIKYTLVKFIIDDIKHAKYNLQNLFNGDKLLGGQMLTFLNENWKEVFAETKPGIEQTMSEVVKFLISPMSRVPYDYLFPPK